MNVNDIFFTQAVINSNCFSNKLISGTKLIFWAVKNRKLNEKLERWTSFKKPSWNPNQSRIHFFKLKISVKSSLTLVTKAATSYEVKLLTWNSWMLLEQHRTINWIVLNECKIHRKIHFMNWATSAWGRQHWSWI